MAKPSARAESVARILWELKRAEKLATHTAVAERAGFSPGAGGRTVRTCLESVRRDWPHLQWWRVVSDDGVVEKEQSMFLDRAGFETEQREDERAVVKSLETQTMVWATEEES